MYLDSMQTIICLVFLFGTSAVIIEMHGSIILEVVVLCINQLPTDTFNKTYAYRSNRFSRIIFYKPAIFVIVIFFKTLFLSHYNS